MPWRLAFTRRADRDLNDLTRRDREAVGRALERAAVEPGAADLRKLAGRENQWRLRVGRWRIILKLDTQAGLMLVARVLPRSRAYRD
jgi:mRNA interferase RelE/StbE